jgi:hypothetical protein
MSRGIEGTKSLDSNVERKNLEGTYSSKISEQEPKLDSWHLTERTRKRDSERKSHDGFVRATGGRFGGYSGIGFER